MIAIIIIIIRRSFSLSSVIRISKIFHLGKNPKSGGIPPRLNSKIDMVGMLDLSMWILNELKFLKNMMIEIKMMQ